MAIAEGLAAKAAIGVGTLGAGVTGIYFGGDYLINSLSKYDKALIELLESKEDYDFVFDVKKVESGQSNNDLSVGDITFSGAGMPPTVKVSVKISTSNGTPFKKGANVASNDDLQKIRGLNGEQNWTWECNLTFGRAEGVSETAINTDYKDKIFKDGNKGLFGILKKDLSSYNHTTSTEGDNKWTKQELKQVKIDFIKGCGYSRSLSDNKDINNKLKGDNVVKSDVTSFIFKNGSGNDLVPQDKDTFENWFKKKYKDNEYQS